jgi:hypothetical protein
VLYDVKIAALEGTRSDTVVNRDSETLVGFDRAKIFTTPPPVRHAGNNSAVRRHHRRVACKNLVRQNRIRFVQMHLHVGRPVGRYHFRVLTPRDIRIEFVSAPYAFLGHRTGFQPLVVIGGAEQHVTQHAVLAVDAPVFKHGGLATLPPSS